MTDKHNTAKDVAATDPVHELRLIQQMSADLTRLGEELRVALADRSIRDSEADGERIKRLTSEVAKLRAENAAMHEAVEMAFRGGAPEGVETHAAGIHRLAAERDEWKAKAEAVLSATDITEDDYREHISRQPARVNIKLKKLIDISSSNQNAKLLELQKWAEEWEHVYGQISNNNLFNQIEHLLTK